MPNYQGHCACGAVHYQAAAQPRRPQYCGCGLCRQTAGAAVVLSVDFPEASFRWIGAKPIFYSAQGQSRRGFCGRCGGAVCTLDGEGSIRVHVDTLDPGAGIAPRSHVHVRYAAEPVPLARAG